MFARRQQGMFSAAQDLVCSIKLLALLRAVTSMSIIPSSLQGKAKRSDFYAQLRIVGNNYNQTLKGLKSHFSERRTMALVCKLKKDMIQLVLIMNKVTEMTDEYQKSGENNTKM